MEILLLTANSVTIELNNNDCYETATYKIYLNDIFLRTDTHNVFTIYDLKPNTSYNLLVNDEAITFKTKNKKLKFYKPSFDMYETETLQKALDNIAHDETLVIDSKISIISVFLRNNNSIYLTKNAVIHGCIDRRLYPILKKDEYLNGKVLGTWEGYADDCFASIITGLGVKNITIYGEGIIDCQAQNSDWWINHREKRIARRPKGIFLHTCENIYFEGFSVNNTPSWNQHPFYSKNVNYLRLNLLNPKNSPTTDGIDPESCDKVNIIGTKISVGDDCIAIKSGKLDFAKLYHTPSSNIIIRNCLMEYGHAGVTLGSENSGGIKDVCVSKCLLRHTDRGLRIKSQRGRGNIAVIENITFKNIIMDEVKSPFVINAFYKAGTDILDERFDRSYKEPSDMTPKFLRFSFEDIVCTDVSYGLGYFLGLPESMIESITLKNISVTYDLLNESGYMAMTPDIKPYHHIGIFAENIGSLILSNVNFIDAPSKKFIYKNVLNIKEI